jgi:type I restriction enzyme M protein
MANDSSVAPSKMHPAGKANGAAKESVPPASPRSFNAFSEIVNFLWQNAERLRGVYKPNDYDKVILPLLVIRRLDCVLEPTKDRVLAEIEKLKGKGVKLTDPLADKLLQRAARLPFYNTSKLDFERLKGDPNHIASNFRAYLKAFSPGLRDIIEKFKLDQEIERLDEHDRLYVILNIFADVDVHPDKVPNHVMGSIFEELIRRFNEKKNEEAGDHYTPREVIRLMVDLLFSEDDDVLRRPGIVRSLFDPACGTGGMLSVAEEYLRELNPEAKLEVFGQTLLPETYAVCKADMLMRGQNADNIAPLSSLSKDAHSQRTFDYMLSNPPFGVEWKDDAKVIEEEYEKEGFAGRFGAGLPRINDGSLLFLMHMISKMKKYDLKTGEGGSRLAIVFNGSPLFTGDAGSGESEIRRWIIENDWLEAIIALPDQLFYNTGISTYLWIVTNRKEKARRGKVQLINGGNLFVKMRRALGEKKKELTREHIALLAKTYGDFLTNDISKRFDNEDFGYRRVTVERPLRLSFQASPARIARLQTENGFAGLVKSKKKGEKGALEAESGRVLQEQIVRTLGNLDPKRVVKNRDAFEKLLRATFEKASVSIPASAWKAILAALSERDETADVCTDSKGRPEPDVGLRDSENVPLKEDVGTFFRREVSPYSKDAWIDESRTKVGYEILFTRYFYTFEPPEPLDRLHADITRLEGDLQRLLLEMAQ